MYYIYIYIYIYYFFNGASLPLDLKSSYMFHSMRKKQFTESLRQFNVNVHMRTITEVTLASTYEFYNKLLPNTF